MLFWSANFGNRELRMVQKTLEICLSETHASGNREVWTKDPSPEAMLIPDAKETMEKEWKEVRKKAQKETTSKSTSTSRWMFERAVSSVEIMCFMNLYICDLLSLRSLARMTGSKHETKARRSWTQTARFLEISTMTWMERNIPNRYSIEEITEEERWSRKKGQKSWNWYNH